MNIDVDVLGLDDKSDEETCKNLYDYYVDNPNNFSYWFDKIKDVKNFKIPKTKVFQVPMNLMTKFGENKEEDFDAVREYISTEVIPNTKDLRSFVFIKNGCFSNKFDFSKCCTPNTSFNITVSLLDINAMSYAFDTGGVTELIVREYIDAKDAYEIYNGMPLRPEIRVFYDFDKKKVLYSVNYWDYDYCYENINNKTDKVIFELAREHLEKTYNDKHLEIENLVAQDMQNVHLTGRWSIDIMLEGSEMYLIDMAVAECSAYWKNDSNV